MIDFFGTDSKFANLLATLVLVFVIGLFGTMITNSIFADGKVTHCYVEGMGIAPAYKVVGHREWRGDVTLSVEKTSEDAYAKMKHICH